ncbi:hypothetical protein [Nonomuraea sp. NPDC001699]
MVYPVVLPFLLRPVLRDAPDALPSPEHACEVFTQVFLHAAATDNPTP